MKGFQLQQSGTSLLSVEEAQRRVLEATLLLGTERVALTEAVGRVLREEITAAADVPQADNSAMDGYAVRSADIASATEGSPVVLRVVEDVPAGRVARESVQEGTAIRIMTGALLPNGSDVVVPVELTDGGSDRVEVRRAVPTGRNVRRRGEDMIGGQVVLAPGTVLGAAAIGVLATAARPVVTVGRRPTVAVISTGDEIIDIDAPAAPGKVRNSNAYSLSALVREAGAVPRVIGIVEDTKEATMAVIRSAAESDFAISTGGVSVGAYDFVKEALIALGAETMFWQIAMKPGKPVVLSRLNGKLYFGLPGNPVSCMVSFLLFIAPSIRKAMGQTGDLLPPTVHARLEAPLRSAGDRRAYQRVRLVARDGGLVALPMSSQGSGVSTSMVGANGLAVVETGIRSVDAGETVPVVVIGPIV